MLIQGSFDASHIVQEFLAREYAFCCIWKNKELRVAHYKGTWQLAKIIDGVVQDYISIDDGSTIETKNDLLRGLAETKFEIVLQKQNSDFQNRDLCSFAIVSTIKNWIGKLSLIETIKCLQEGRNSWLDKKTGEISLDPRKDEWKN